MRGKKQIQEPSCQGCAIHIGPYPEYSEQKLTKTEAMVCQGDERSRRRTYKATLLLCDTCIRNVKKGRTLNIPERGYGDGNDIEAIETNEIQVATAP